MLITTNTMLPQRHSSGLPVANGWLYARESKNPGSPKLELYRDAELKESAPNPITLNSAGELPYPVYAKENSAWCHLYAIADGREDYIRSYPLREMPSGDNLKEPKEFISLKAKIQTKAETVICHENIQSDIAQSTKTDAINTETTKLQVAKEIQGNLGETITKETIMSLVYIGTDQTKNNPNNPDDWWEAFKIGSYAIAVLESSRNYEYPYVMEPFRLGSEILTEGTDKDGEVLQGGGKRRCRVCGRTSDIISYDHYITAHYLICRMA